MADVNTPPPGGFANGGWYWDPSAGQAKQYWNGGFGASSTINNPNQQGYGQVVSDEVQKQSNPNLAPGHGDNPQAAAASGAGGFMSTPNAGQSAFNIEDTYNKAMNAPEILAAKSAIDAVDGQINDRRTALNTAANGVNDNPWYSEATRTGSLAKLQSSADADINTYLQDRQSKVDNYNRLTTEAQQQVNMAMDQYNINRQSYQDAISNFNNLVSTGAIMGATPQDINQLAVQTGMSPDMINGVIKAAQAKEIAPQIVTTTDGSGNVHITAVDKNTGKIINENVIGGAGKGFKGSSSSGDQNGLTKQDYVGYLQGDVKNGADLKSVIQHYQPYLSSSQIYQIYSSNSPYGAPKETAAQAAAGQFADQKGFVSKNKPPVQ